MSFSRFAIAFIAATAFVFTGCEDIETMEECYDTLEAMQTTVRDVVFAGEGCVNDAECVLYDPSNSCYGACPVSINMRDISWINMTIEEAEKVYCEDFATNCWYDEPESCPPVKPVCEMGRCTVQTF